MNPVFEEGARFGAAHERILVVAMLKRAVFEADDKMFRNKDSQARRDFAAASVTLTHIIDLIEDGQHRQTDHD